MFYPMVQVVEWAPMPLVTDVDGRVVFDPNAYAYNDGQMVFRNHKDLQNVFRQLAETDCLYRMKGVAEFTAFVDFDDVILSTNHSESRDADAPLDLLPLLDAEDGARAGSLFRQTLVADSLANGKSYVDEVDAWSSPDDVSLTYMTELRVHASMRKERVR